MQYIAAHSSHHTAQTGTVYLGTYLVGTVVQRDDSERDFPVIFFNNPTRNVELFMQIPTRIRTPYASTGKRILRLIQAVFYLPRIISELFNLSEFPLSGWQTRISDFPKGNNYIFIRMHYLGLR